MASTNRFFVNENIIEVNKKNYCKRLKNSCFLHLKNLLSVMTGFLSKILSRHIDQILVQNFFEKTLKHRFGKCVECSSSSTDINPLDYFFWNLAKTKIYQGWRANHFRIRIKIENTSFVERLCNRFETVTKRN